MIVFFVSFPLTFSLLFFQNFDVCDAMKACYQVYTSRKVKSVLLIPPEIEEGTPHWVRADRSRMCQIVGNLLSNSCKFTLNGSIGVTVKSERCENEEYLLITVKVRGFYFF